MTTAVPTTPTAPVRTAARPFVLLAAVAFVLGFLGYVALDRPASAAGQLDAAMATEPAAAGPASDDWNFPKHI